MPNPTRRLFGDNPRGDTSERTAASEEQQANKDPQRETQVSNHGNGYMFRQGMDLSNLAI